MTRDAIFFIYPLDKQQRQASAAGDRSETDEWGKTSTLSPVRCTHLLGDGPSSLLRFSIESDLFDFFDLFGEMTPISSNGLICPAEKAAVILKRKPHATCRSAR